MSMRTSNKVGNIVYTTNNKVGIIVRECIEFGFLDNIHDHSNKKRWWIFFPTESTERWMYDFEILGHKEVKDGSR